MTPHWLRFAFRRLTLSFAILAVAFAGASAPAKDLAPPAGVPAKDECVPAKDEFSRLVQLAPFVVRGQQLAISIHARTNRDRSYALGFAEDVIKVVHESGVSGSPGRGLVIIGAKGEPHPIHFFRQFLALAESGKLDPAVAARAAELHASIEHWQRHSARRGNGNGKSAISIESDAKDGEVDLEFERIVTALPLPLDGLGAQLYQLAWFEKFDDAKVEARLRALHAEDLQRDLFARYDWVFYLPPKGAFDQVLDDIIADALKHEDVGFVGRMALKGVMLVVKPKIRQVIEGVRKGLLFHTVTQARTQFDEDDVSTLTSAYVEESIPFGKDNRSGDEHERAVQAIREKLQQLRTQPATTPEPTEPAKD